MKNDEKERKQQWENDEKIEKNMKNDEKERNHQ
jgi:hypothetical protein